MKDQGHPHRFAAAREVLERTTLHAFGVEPPLRTGFHPNVTVQTHVNRTQPRVAEMSDADLEAYDRLLTKFRELLPKGEPKRIGSMTCLLSGP
jgi:uncharacterized protein involved in propanediol utilization